MPKRQLFECRAAQPNGENYGAYLRQLPAPLAGINLQHGLASHRAELVKTLEAGDGRIELRAVTGPRLGRTGITSSSKR